MSNPIYRLFKLILTSSLDLDLDNVYKILRLSKAILEEGLKHFSRDGLNVCTLNLPLILLSTIQDLIFQKSCYKKDSILADSSSDCKMVFAF